MSIFDKMLKLGLQRITVLPNNSGIPEAAWVSERMRREGHEKVVIIFRPDVNLRAAIAIHDRTLAQSLGGCRLLPYSNEKEMIEDVLRLSKAMTYKSAMADVARGGGKCVVWSHPKDKNYAMLVALAEEINNLNGEYITGEDMNIDERDIYIMRNITPYAAGLPETYRDGRFRGSGDPSPVTARGIVYGMKACLKFLEDGSLDGKVVAIQGLGKVGFRLARFLYQEGVRKIIACDINPQRLDHFREEFQSKTLLEFRSAARIVQPEEIFHQECDIFAPCAGGLALNQNTIPQLRCRIVAGAANNQLASSECGRQLMERGILYAPDYVINAGGLINVDDELHPEGYNEVRVQQKLERIFHNLLRVFWYSRRLRMPTNEVADMLAEEKIYMHKCYN